MRRPGLIAAALLGAVVLAGCGSQGVATPTPKTVIGTVATTSLPVVPAFHLKGDSKKGSSVFASAGCGGCHTLKAAGSSGTTGPNLDAAKPSAATVAAIVTGGAGIMPAFKDRLPAADIQAVARYVADSAGG